MSVIEAIILGILQGITELLPVSSSGHLRLGRELFGFLGQQTGDENLAFDVLMHVGTLAVVLIAFRKEIISLLKGRRKVWIALFLASIPAGLLGVGYKLAMKAYAPEFEFPVWVIGIAYLFCGSFLMVVEKRTRDEFDMDALTAKQSLIIGLAQAIAILPGVSRSGMTILTGGALGLKRTDAMAFSFLMSLIAIGGATLIELKDIADLGSQNAGALVAGFLASFLSGLFAIWTLRKIVQKKRMAWFGPYCIALGLASIVLAFR